MTKVIFVTQKLDPGHPLLGATVAKVRALAARVEEVVVVADGVAEGVLPANARARPFGAASRAGRGARFAAALAAELRPRRQRTAVLAHMSPIYAVLAAPLARPLGVPVLLWYTQWHAGRLLRAAERVATHVVTVEHASFPLASRKVVPIGHGIDVGAYSCRPSGAAGGLRALALGRYAPVKGYAAIVDAARLAVAAGADVRLEIHGPVSNERELRHRRELERLVRASGLDGRVVLHDAVPPAAVPELLAGADVLVSNTVRGAADKVVLEACASCVPVLAPAHAFAGLLPDELRFPGDDAAALAERLRELAGRDPRERGELGRSLRQRVVDRHSVDSWADAVVRVAFAQRASASS